MGAEEIEKGGVISGRKRVSTVMIYGSHLKTGQFCYEEPRNHGVQGRGSIRTKKY